jgi:hypothetical protein
LSVSGCALCELKTSKEVKDKLNMFNLNEVIVDFRRRWTQQLLRMNGTCAPNFMFC